MTDDLFSLVHDLARIERAKANIRKRQQDLLDEMERLNRERRAIEEASYQIFEAAGCPDVLVLCQDLAFEFSNDGSLAPGLLVTAWAIATPLSCIFAPKPGGSADRADIVPIPAEAEADAGVDAPVPPGVASRYAVGWHSGDPTPDEREIGRRCCPEEVL